MDGSRLAGFAETPLSGACCSDLGAGSVTGFEGALAQGARYRVCALRLGPGEGLSLQSHLHRAKVWTVVEGTARVVLGSTARLVSEGETILVPVGQPHRADNPGRLSLLMIAVETGGYLGQDDVIRHDLPGSGVCPMGRSL